MSSNPTTTFTPEIPRFVSVSNPLRGSRLCEPASRQPLRRLTVYVSDIVWELKRAIGSDLFYCKSCGCGWVSDSKAEGTVFKIGTLRVGGNV